MFIMLYLLYLCSKLHFIDTFLNLLSFVYVQNLICKRDSSYRSSPIAQDPSCYAKYEVSSSPEEWKFVERLLPSTLIPIPSDRKDLPSGWQPQTGEQHQYNVLII